MMPRRLLWLCCVLLLVTGCSSRTAESPLDQVGIQWKEQVGAADLGCKGLITAATPEEVARSPFPMGPVEGFTLDGSTIDACDGRVVSGVAYYRDGDGRSVWVAFWALPVSKKREGLRVVELAGTKVVEQGSNLLFVRPYGLVGVQSDELGLSRAMAQIFMKDGR